MYAIIKRFTTTLDNITKTINLFIRVLIKIGNTMDQKLGAQDIFLNSRGGTCATHRENNFTYVPRDPSVIFREKSEKINC